jgi:hypothetical protein
MERSFGGYGLVMAAPFQKKPLKSNNKTEYSCKYMKGLSIR